MASTSFPEGPPWILDAGLGFEIRFTQGAMRAIAASRPEAAEIFGLLLGRRDYAQPVAALFLSRLSPGRSRERAVIEVTGCEPLWAGRAGVRISRRERKRLRAAIEEAGGRPLDSQPLGWYRIQTAPPDTPGGAFEFEIAERLFRDQGTVFLVVGAGGARLFLRDPAGLLTGFARPVSFPFAGPVADFAPAPQVRRQTSLVRRTAFATALGGALGAAAYVSMRPAGDTARETSPTRLPPATAFVVESEQTAFRVRWNPAAPFFKGEKGAMLFIEDGAESRALTIDLGSERGELLYSPRSGSVEFRMRTIGPAGRVETVHVNAPEGMAPLRQTPRPARVLKAPAPVGAAAAVPAPPARKPQPEKVPAVEPPAPTPPVPAPYVAARIIEGIEPPLRPGDRDTLPADVTISVTAAVDEFGRVISAEAQPNPAIRQPVLYAAERAARLTRFEPARYGGKPVESRIVIRYRLVRDSARD